MAEYKLSLPGPEVDRRLTNAVLYAEQGLTDDQKAQVRENIGVVAAVDINNVLQQAKDSGQFDGKDGTNGRDGTSVTITNISESTTAGGSNIVTFSDGKSITIKNGTNGKDGTDANVTTSNIVAALGYTPVNASELGTLAKKSSVAKTDLASAVQTSLNKADSALQSYTETDPTVPGWAKAATKPSYTYNEVGAAKSTIIHIGDTAPTDSATEIWVNTAEEYEDVVPNTSVLYSNQILTESQKAQARANTDSVGKSELTLGVKDGLIYIFVGGVPVGNGIEQGVSGDVVGYVNANNTIVFTGALADGIYTVKYEMSDGTMVNIGELALDNTEPDEPVEPEVVNYFDAATAALNKRIGSSGSLSDRNGIVVSDFIPVDSSMAGKVFTVVGVSPIVGETYKYSVRTAHYDGNKALISGTFTEYGSAGNGPFGGIVYAWDSDMTVTNAYIRISFQLKDNVALTADDIKDITITMD